MFRFHSVTCGYPGFPAPLVQSVSCSVTSCSFWPYGLYCPPGSSVHGILQLRILEWVAIPSSRGLPDPGITPRSRALQADSLPTEPETVFFFSIVYPHLLCHRLIDGECAGLLPGFLSCSWIFTKKRIYFFPLELQKSTSRPWGAHSAQNQGVSPHVIQLISRACFTSNPKTKMSNCIICTCRINFLWLSSIFSVTIDLLSVSLES